MRNTVGTLGTKIKSINYISNSQLRVCHIASHNINMGDGAITAGIRKFMREISANLTIIDFDIIDFNKQAYHLVADEINELSPDLIIVGGGGTIDGHKSRIYTGTALQLPIREIEKINAPLAFWGLGHNVFYDQQVFNMDALDNFVQFCESKGFPFSVRRDLSKQRLAEVLSKDAIDYIQEVPDPGFFVPVNAVAYGLTPDASRKNVLIQIALDTIGLMFCDSDSLEKFINHISQIMLYLIGQHQADVTFALHILPDSEVANLFRMFLNNDEQNNKLRLHARILGVTHPSYAASFFANYANADLIIGMRGHSVICGTGLRVPTIAVSTHSKVRGYMEEIGCLEWCLDLDSSQLEFMEKIDRLMDAEDATHQKEIIMSKTEHWEDESRNFAYQCFNLV